MSGDTNQTSPDGEEIKRLTAIIEDLRTQLEQQLKANEELREMLKKLQVQLDSLLVQKKKRSTREYGKKTEKFNPRPALSKNTTLESDAKVRKPGIKHIVENAENLPTERISYQVEDEHRNCPSCDIETEFVKNVLSQQLEMVSSSLKVLQHCQETRACPKCKTYIVTASKPVQPIPGSYAGPRLLAETIVSKFEDGLPNYRQEKIFARQNVVIPRSTQSDWIQTTAATLTLLHELQIRELLKSKIIKTDDSSMKVQDRDHKNNIRKSKITVYVGDDATRVTIFDYSPSLSFDKNKEFLDGFAGTIQADAASGFNALFINSSRIEAGCNAHSRRKYFEAEFTDQEICGAVLEVYRRLYKVESEIRSESPEFRLAMRRRKSKPLVKELRSIVERARDTLNPTHEVMKAVKYTLNHWRALTRFLKNPDIAIDNNEAERAIKRWVLVRNNSLFAGSDDGAKAAALHLSFISTCKRNGINPVDWYADVLAKINSLKTSQLQQLLPQKWTKP